MRAELLRSPARASETVVLNLAAFRRHAPSPAEPIETLAPDRRLSWPTCVAVWLALSAAAWGAVALVASQLG
jgi:hypothetical protein